LSIFESFANHLRSPIYKKIPFVFFSQLSALVFSACACPSQSRSPFDTTTAGRTLRLRSRSGSERSNILLFCDSVFCFLQQLFKFETMSDDWIDVSVAQDGGVKKQVIRAAPDDAEKPQAKFKCRVHYTGILTDTSK
jgi:hypothetical protein